MAGSSVSAPMPWQEAYARSREVLGRRPAGLICDVDGVLSPIAPTPDAAVVSPAARSALARLAGVLDLVAVVSGRAAASAMSMVDLPNLVYVGNHGMEMVTADGGREEHPQAVGAGGVLTAALEEVLSAVAGLPFAPDVLTEHKGLTATIHYRLAADAEVARAAILPAAVAAAERRGLVATEGRLIVELRPNIVVNKGTAIVDLVARYRLRGIVFLGDDVTDVDGFAALRALRERGEVNALAIGVLAAETPAAVIAAMDVGIAGVAAVEQVLGALAEELGASGEGAAGDEAGDTGSTVSSEPPRPAGRG